jgi:hypothetical protein
MFKQYKLADDLLLGNTNTISEGYPEQVLSILKGKPFWIWDEKEHEQEYVKTDGLCCFNDICGRPTKDKHEMPMFHYEKILYDSLISVDGSFKDKHLWVKKATGLVVTEFMLRLMAWLCTRDETFDGSQMCIVTGPNIEMATKLIKRTKGIFEPKLGLKFRNKETVLELNGCTIEAYPSNHIDSYRALDNPKFILLDESDFLRKGEQDWLFFYFFFHQWNRWRMNLTVIGSNIIFLVTFRTYFNPGNIFAFPVDLNPASSTYHWSWFIVMKND